MFRSGYAYLHLFLLITTAAAWQFDLLPAGWSYHGCWKSSATSPYPLSEPFASWGDPMTSTGCASWCACRGYAYAALQLGSQCLCGDTLERSAKGSDMNCNYQCEGNTTQFCGGCGYYTVFRDTSVPLTASERNASMGAPNLSGEMGPVPGFLDCPGRPTIVDIDPYKYRDPNNYAFAAPFNASLWGAYYLKGMEPSLSSMCTASAKSVYSSSYLPTATVSPSVSDATIPPFTPTFTSPCCSSCTLDLYSAQVMYWPTATPGPSTLVNDQGYTL